MMEERDPLTGRTLGIIQFSAGTGVWMFVSGGREGRLTLEAQSEVKAEGGPLLPVPWPPSLLLTGQRAQQSPNTSACGRCLCVPPPPPAPK